MKLLNVRLDADDARMAAALRREGLQLSRVVREAIRAEYAQRLRVRAAGRDARAVLAEIHAAHPDAPVVAPRGYDVHDARAARQAIRKAVRRNRS